jgi:GNAT superfamily N-acetyltransferase
MKSPMQIRSAQIADIPRIQVVRHLVRENVLRNPALVTDQDVHDYITARGKGWVAVVEDIIVGFSIVDLQDHNVWALFLDPQHEAQGFGRQLHDTMLDWYFSQTDTPIWLGTEPGTRAERFYRKAGWQEIGVHGKGEVKFEMHPTHWIQRNRYTPR